MDSDTFAIIVGAAAVGIIVVSTLYIFPKLRRQGTKMAISMENKKREKRRIKEGRKVADRLEAIGYFTYADPVDVPILKKTMADHYYPNGGLVTELGWYSHGKILSDYRLYDCDAEDLYELGGYHNLIAKLRQAFDKRGFRFDVTDDSEYFDDNGRYYHSITVNGTQYTIFKGFDTNNNGWGLAALRFAKMLNAELQKQGQPDRAYLISGGNEQELVLLTSEQYQYTSMVFTNPYHKPQTPDDWALVMDVQV